MKKIITAVAAVAMATTMFAADFAAGTKILVNVFQKDGDNIGVLSQFNDSHAYANPNFVFNASGDKAGATLKITSDGGDAAPVLKEQAIWVKPFDMLKITVGAYDIALNKETIDWTESITALGGEGFLASLNIDAFSMDVGLNNGDSGTQYPWGAWWLSNNGTDTTIAHTFAKFGYSADFGSIGAYVALNHDCGQRYNPQDTFYMAYKNKDNLSFAAAYKGSFGPVNAFVNVVGGMFSNKFEWIRPEVFVNGSVDSFGYALFAAPGIYMAEGKNAECEVVTKLTYGINGVTPYFYFKDANVLAESFGCTIKLGVSGSVSPVNYDACVQLDVANSAVNVNVPVALSVNF